MRKGTPKAMVPEGQIIPLQASHVYPFLFRNACLKQPEMSALDSIDIQPCMKLWSFLTLMDI